MSCDSCFKGFAQILLIIVNLIFMLAGLLMLGLGIAIVVSPEKVLSYFESNNLTLSDFAAQFNDYPISLIRDVGIFMIVLGGVVALVALLGFIGALCQEKCPLIAYTVVLVIVVLAEVALIIFATRYPNKLEKGEESTLYNSLVNKFDHDIVDNSSAPALDYSSLSPFGASMSLVQNKFQCCGVNNFTDYKTFNWTQANCDGRPCVAGLNLVPSSCCVLKSNATIPPQSLNDYVDYAKCMGSADPSVTNVMNGCVDAIDKIGQSLVKQYSKIAIGIAAGIVGLELLLICLAIIISCTSRGSEKFA